MFKTKKGRYEYLQICWFYAVVLSLVQLCGVPISWWVVLIPIIPGIAISATIAREQKHG